MFYATVMDITGRKRGILAGPYRTHGAALAASERCRVVAHQVNHSEAAFAAFGTARVKTREARERIGVPKLQHLIEQPVDVLP